MDARRPWIVAGVQVGSHPSARFDEGGGLRTSSCGVLRSCAPTRPPLVAESYVIHITLSESNAFMLALPAEVVRAATRAANRCGALEMARR